MLKFLTINTGAEMVCFTIALICLIKDRLVAWRRMILFLALTISAEMLGIDLKKPYLDYLKKLGEVQKLHLHFNIISVHSNIWVYNILLVFQASFISLMFLRLLKTYKSSKPLIIWGLAILGLLYTFEVTSHGVFEKHNVTTITMSIMFIIYSFYYFYCLQKDDACHDLKSYAPFWWVTGVLFFYFGRIASIIFFQILATYDPKFVVTVPIYNVLNIILYSCWSYSFICRKWEAKKLGT